MVATAQAQEYKPIPVLEFGKELKDTLSTKDIPFGDSGFARDYFVNLASGDQVIIEVKSDSFDTIVTLLSANGSTAGENDDGPDGTTNSLLFARIVKSGKYIIRVHAFGDKKETGPFSLKVTRLQPEK
ncbi:PPC domain-containing protein [Aetokthonos hydrillicola Thurmond2011]|uniref:PPC domain-containing protein n=1 Tax=Aetokthonos hydrillicola Thurmond2011 TaxID=2712845 RepID=A0AAP5I9T3_9CYAN|nr:PPC domain-containing protein [Aetokthonos hydrillicola]MDR9896364.1 PPC domain-containing protein [Aetokthonos hydrillicola Thurmond2011]